MTALARCASHAVEDCPRCGCYLVIDPDLRWRILISEDGSEGATYSPDLHRDVPGHSCQEMCERDMDGGQMRLITEFLWTDNDAEVGQLNYDVRGHGPYPEHSLLSSHLRPDWPVRRWRLLNSLVDGLMRLDDPEYVANVREVMDDLWSKMSDDERVRAEEGLS